MFSHVTLGSNDIAASKRFYDAILGVLGAPEGVVDERGRLIYMHAGGRLVITRPVDGDAAACGNGHTLGFLALSPDMIDAWHAAGIANGGTTAEGPPGVRNATEGRTVYLAYLRDPDGNKLCGFHKISG
ncbi:VOC family protein [Sphingopyxis sp. JAI128]|uniref:VOC family protein n=1 Tax=Sphingopyxis sp. JAI128 TaxID=2723066 RepID=UPI00161F5BAC|nr:VOC family protein [Sphingopyxis sp. JAI128]MBB6428111.1 catechol 2,3-dioxygenase-like lactoylglutathione lyase family enzyme [Sphingopyxis sp. JAI128]